MVHSEDIIYNQRIEDFKNKLLGFTTVNQGVCQFLTNSIVNVEQRILALGPANYKEAPANSITTRHEYYNLIDMLPTQLTFVKRAISEISSTLIGGEEFYVKMWANIFRNGERIERHMHHASPIIENESFKKNVFKTLCGNLFIHGDAPSETIYYGKEKIIMPNTPGDIHLFSCILEHETLPYTGNLRVGIAFDIYTKTFFSDIGMKTPGNLRLISKNSI
jgi:hypothetical protein